jgi:hypothetical protein
VTGYVVVDYRYGTYAKARIHGSITGAIAGEIATLYAQSFPFAKTPAPVGSATLTATGTDAYSFTVTPTLETRYTVKLFAGRTAARPRATSPVQNVYVAIVDAFTGTALCAPDSFPGCQVTFRVIVIVPSSALRIEMSKPLYPYFDLSNGPPNSNAAPKPKWLYLNAGHPVISAPHQVSADKFEWTITFTFTPTDNGSATWDWLGCDKDTLSEDGIGLPGHHGCGARRVRPNVEYLG